MALVEITEHTCDVFKCTEIIFDDNSETACFKWILSDYDKVEK